MTFLTYAQNFEDVLLWRALGHIKNGFYIDVGANDPELHSVTKAFYDAGWWGINIEPMPSYHQAFIDQRPRDVNLTVAAGATDGHITLFEVPSMNGWASTDRAVADAHRADGYNVVETDVPLQPLKDICAEYTRGDIHFLKIDVEGFEAEVLRGMDFQRWRPWVLVIEATMPNSRQTNHETWEALVTAHDYHFAYFDGLNRYYVAAEHSELREVLGLQANVFDEFISHHLDKAWRNGERLGLALQQSESQRLEDARLSAERMAGIAAVVERVTRAQLDAELKALNYRASAELAEADRQLNTKWAKEMEQHLVAIQSSRTWRIISGINRVRHFLLRAPGGAVRRSVRLMRRLGGNQLARRVLMLMKRLAPGPIERLLRVGRPLPLKTDAAAAVALVVKSPDAARGDVVPPELAALPQSVRGVLSDLVQQAVPPSSK